jgi:hypothetical protein
MLRPFRRGLRPVRHGGTRATGRAPGRSTRRSSPPGGGRSPRAWPGIPWRRMTPTRSRRSWPTRRGRATSRPWRRSADLELYAEVWTKFGFSQFGVGGPARGEAGIALIRLLTDGGRTPGQSPVHRQPRFPVRRWRWPRIFFGYLSVNSALIHPKKISSCLGLLANPEALRQSTTQCDQCIRSPNSRAEQRPARRFIREESQEVRHLFLFPENSNPPNRSMPRAPAALPPTQTATSPDFLGTVVRCARCRATSMAVLIESPPSERR